MSDKIEQPEDSTPTRLDDVQLDAAVGGTRTALEPCLKTIAPCIKTIVPCVKVIRPG